MPAPRTYSSSSSSSRRARFAMAISMTLAERFCPGISFHLPSPCSRIFYPGIPFPPHTYPCSCEHIHHHQGSTGCNLLRKEALRREILRLGGRRVCMVRRDANGRGRERIPGEGKPLTINDHMLCRRQECWNGGQQASALLASRLYAAQEWFPRDGGGRLTVHRRRRRR
ncbi:uncharacterized protein LY79DRAFT_532809 [Colletotrichum navitas]|uniref:Uncharacterized protein n=1 Tax=Colletotrichum navitas TaxID=681940 RepID=A0AAD8VAA5_9PEZI|nr:uncharacterized protein LY79DRAFT_532809 [Colletotrichum navitas]KAK1600182.1 hypothetical protein LY79DRAFT_532809 [Colletotrichum navitas]